MPQLLGSGPGASKRLFSVIPGDSPKLLIRAWNLLSRFPNHGVSAERKGRDWQAAWLFLQQATTLLILWFDVSSSGVPQVKQTAWSSPSGAAGKKQALSAGWHNFWNYSLPGQVSAGWSLQTGLKCFEQNTTGSQSRILAGKSWLHKLCQMGKSTALLWDTFPVPWKQDIIM